MSENFKKFLELWDIPSGSILGLFTLVVIGMCIWATVGKWEIPTTVVDIYKFVVMSFAGSKAVKTVWGKPKE